MSRPLLIVVVGPTASGKTAFSIELALRFRTEIISADSRQFYREMEIGTAKPTVQQLKKVPHHFINSLSVHEEYSAGKYETEALECIQKLFVNHNAVLLTGGSFLFVDAVCNGFDKLPPASAELREKYDAILRQQGIRALQELLHLTDPVYYNEADINNPRRLIRALEVIELTGNPYSLLRNRKPKKRGFDIVKIGLTTEKDELVNRINSRVEKMIDEGWLDECKRLYPLRKLNALQTVGYVEIFDYLDSKCDLNSAVERIKTETWHYAKRQLTWLRRDKDIIWFAPAQTDEAVQYITRTDKQ